MTTGRINQVTTIQGVGHNVITRALTQHDHMSVPATACKISHAQAITHNARDLQVSKLKRIGRESDDT
jgi:hypothetical protein